MHSSPWLRTLRMRPVNECVLTTTNTTNASYIAESTLPEHMLSSPSFAGIRVAFFVCLVDFELCFDVFRLVFFRGFICHGVSRYLWLVNFDCPNFTISNIFFLILPFSQNFPLKPVLHIQVNPFTSSLHVPPLTQGLDLQSSTSKFKKNWLKVQTKMNNS